MYTHIAAYLLFMFSTLARCCYSLFIFLCMSCLSNGKYQNFQAQVSNIVVFIGKIPFACRKWVWRAAIVTCHVWSDNDLHGPYSMRVMESNANVVNFGAFSWTMLHFCNVCNSATGFFSISCVVVLRENAAISVCALLFSLNKIGVRLFCHLFLFMLLQKWLK